MGKALVSGGIAAAIWIAAVACYWWRAYKNPNEV